MRITGADELIRIDSSDTFVQSKCGVQSFTESQTLIHKIRRQQRLLESKSKSERNNAEVKKSAESDIR